MSSKYLLLALLVACSPVAGPSSSASVPSAPDSTPTTVVLPPTTDNPPPTTSPPEPGTVRPSWFGTRILPLRPDGQGVAQPTPIEMVNRRFPTIDLLPPPSSTEFVSTLGPVPADVLARSSWHEGCPVTVDQLSYLTVAFWGFDGGTHTGELIVNAEFGEQVVEVMRHLFDARFPIEEMRVITGPEIDAPPTGDGNDTTSYACRPVVAKNSGWSMHAFGLAVDINPFHNPYLKDDLVVPELASAYLDREQGLPGMIKDLDPVVAAFDDMGWEWGGRWQTAKDWMHFSSNGS